MLVEWSNWVRSLRTDEVVFALGILLCVDAPRYVYSAILMALWDLVKGLWTQRMPGPKTAGFNYCPPVTVIIAGHNEADTIASTMESVWSRYPRLQMIVVDDGSTDGMTAAAQAFAEGREQILVIRRDRRGGNLLH
jgi:cellulose synthase/poly-beta-1,6-N-acetylglucosamine synthase-like glycosyltransferase